jgi:hypothetical protein
MSDGGRFGLPLQPPLQTGSATICCLRLVFGRQIQQPHMLPYESASASDRTFSLPAPSDARAASAPPPPPPPPPS